MNRLRVHLLTFLALAVFASCAVFAGAPQAELTAGQGMADITSSPCTSDLDEMIQRRMIRVLVVNSKTFYFLDKGAQRGLTYDVFKAFEDDLNKKLKNKHIRVHVLFVPVSRDELLPALVEGRGDIAAANLTITPERQKVVDFAAPSHYTQL